MTKEEHELICHIELMLIKGIIDADEEELLSLIKEAMKGE